MFLTKIDTLFDIVEQKKKAYVLSLAKELGIPSSSVIKIARYLEQLGFVELDYKNVKGAAIKYLKTPEPEFKHVDETELVNKFKFFKSFQNVKAANKPALINLTRNYPFNFNRNQLIELMTSGADSASGSHINPLLTTNENFQQSLATLSFKLDNASLSYRLESAEQLSYDSIRLNFSVNYFFRAFDSNWSRTNKLVSIDMSVYGLWHPDFNEIIDSSRVENSTGNCYVNQIITPFPVPSRIGMNIMP